MRGLRRWLSSLRRPGVVVGVVAGSLAFAASAPAATVADWRMNEPSGATTMTDSSPSNLSGSIGSAVVTGFAFDGATGYRWLGADRDGVRPERLVTVDSSALNPENDAFAVTLRLKTGAGHQNIVQKGQANTAGGFWKVDMVKGRVFCTFRGANGQLGIGSAETVWDQLWHTVRCERRSTGVSITVDGGTPRTNTGDTGRISNTWPLSIGGKYYCNPPDVGCDYYVGLLDGVSVDRTAESDSTKPEVAFTAPADGSVVNYASTVNLAADAKDDTGVEKVEFAVNGSVRCTDTQAPYECPWRVWTKSGSRNTLRATAYDAAGNTASHTIWVYTL